MSERAIAAGLALLLALTGLTPAAGAEARRFEVMHFWRASAEREALNVIRDEFERRHEVEWEDTPLPGFGRVRKEMLQRIVSGYPPDATLWPPGPDIWALHDMNVIHTLTDLAREQQWREKLPDVVTETLLAGGDFVAVPTSIHGESLVWYSVEIYTELELDYPRTWAQLLDQAAAIHKAGYIAVAMGAPDWEKRLMFSAVLNSLNPQTYLDLFSQGDPTVAGRPEVRRAFEIMAELRDVSRSGDVPVHGAAASALVGDGRAGMQFIGDWVKEEFRNRGQTLGEDYECRVVPGDRSAYIAVVDGFIFPVTGDGDDRALYSEFAGVVLDPRVQVEFALTKGAIPVVKGISDPRFDKCSRFGMEALKQGRLTPSSAMFSISDVGAVIQSVAARLWESRMSPGEAAELLRDELAVVLDLEQTP